MKILVHKIFIPHRSLGTLTLQPRQPGLPQPILRQHPTNRSLQELTSSPLLHHPLHVQALQSSRPRSLLIVELLLHFLACGVDICAASSNNIVSAVGRGVPDGLVLAHQNDGDLGGEPTQGGCAGFGERDVMPGSRVG